MASPVVQQAIESSTNTAGTSHVVTLPTATAGDLLLIILDKGSTSATINAHASLTELLDEASANGLYIAYRWMDGTEPASYTLTSSASTRTARIAYRISGAINPATQAPQIATTATGTSATPDPPSITPGSSKDYLFIAFFGQAGEEADDDTWVNTPPTNYTPSPPRQKSCGTVGTNLGGKIGAAERQLTTGSAENPGTFGVDVSAAWRAQTIMIHPAPNAYSLNCEPGSFSVTGTDATLAKTTLFNAETGSFSVTGVDATLTQGAALTHYSLDCQPGGFTVSGTDATTAYGRTFNAAAGSFAVNGTDATTAKGYSFNAATGSFAVNGADATTAKGYSFNAATGSFAVNGADATTAYGRAFNAEPGSFAVYGVDATLAKAFLFAVDAGAFAVTGIDATLTQASGPLAYEINAEPGAVVVTDGSAELLVDRTINAEAGAFAFAGVDAELVPTQFNHYEIDAQPGHVVVTGVQSELVAPQLLWDTSQGVAGKGRGLRPLPEHYDAWDRNDMRDLSDILAVSEALWR